MSHARRFLSHGPELALAAASIMLTCLGLMAFEMGSRWADPGYLGRLPASSLDGLHRYSETYGWELRPGARDLQGEHWVSVNADGYRGAPVTRERQPGRARVLMLGDSVTFGTYVGDGEPFADLMHRPEQGLEVVNLAVQGFGLGQSLARFEREGRAYQPDVVVLNVCLANDFADTILPVFLYDGRHPKPYYGLEHGGLVLHDRHLRLGSHERLGLWLRDHSHAYNRVVQAVGSDGASQASGGEHWTARRAEALRAPEVALEVGLRVVAELRARVEANGATFVIALHPDKPSFRHATRWRSAFASSPLLRGATLVDLADEYGARGLSFHELTLDSVGHLTPYGHRQAAAILSGVVARTAPAVTLQASLGAAGL